MHDAEGREVREQAVRNLSTSESLRESGASEIATSRNTHVASCFTQGLARSAQRAADLALVAEPSDVGAAHRARFQKFLKPDPATGCVLFTGTRQHCGHGRFTVERRPLLAHRVAWVLSGGDPSSTVNVLHRCGNPACCNPGHLYEGDQRANNLDARRHGVWANGRTAEERARAKEIEADLRAGGISKTDLARKHGVSQQTIYRIARRIRQVDGPSEAAAFSESAATSDSLSGAA